MTTEEIKNYLRIDHTLDDDLVDNLYQSGQEYIKNAIDVTADIKIFDKYKLFDRAALLLTAHWYENRLASVQTSTIGGLLCQESGHKSTNKFDFQFKLLNLIFGGRSFSPVQILKTL
ncbi:phage gp6-like head-tail connector protein [Latilactobacillus curvatus]|uniref:Phage gp6-like head-tail connector protein n=1 Tax=Latilactobacillus curvatus TaxID=28038 RepID=A0A385ADM3_LATCU|nr:head-tail connector protein [Latilactobacillus curvatus]AXN35446.1 phage gp6-like head-tail connector protein [Latilactobacillus curvatus]